MAPRKSGLSRPTKIGGAKRNSSLDPVEKAVAQLLGWLDYGSVANLDLLDNVVNEVGADPTRFLRKGRSRSTAYLFGDWPIVPRMF